MTNEVKQTPPDVAVSDADRATMELGQTFLVAEPLTEEEDRRILRLIDLKYVAAGSYYRHHSYRPW